jgi:hypothetical protein
MQGEQQHYIPRFLLKNFTRGKKPKIFVYDKSNDKRFHTNIKNISAENGFYDLEVEDGVLTMEPGLARLEANTSGIIKKLIKDRNIKSLSEEEVAILALFLAVQFVRTKEHRLRFEHLGIQLAQKLHDMGASEENIKELIGSSGSVPEDKLFGLRSLVEARGFVPHFLSKAWVLLETTPRNPFFISDNPIGLHNDMDFGPYGNLGLAVKGIQIYLPISSTLCLNLLCPTIAEEFIKGYDNLRLLDHVAPGLADSGMKRRAFARAFCDGLVNGTPIRVVEDNVTLINSLQVVYSSRFVYCESNAFELVERMIRDNRKYREGLKPLTERGYR